jgi:hypothetical protein
LEIPAQHLEIHPEWGLLAVLRTESEIADESG